MIDLLGDTITTPIYSGSSLINTAWGFTEFWKAWPPGPRKVAKQQCLNKWAKYDCSKSASHIVMHVEWLKTQDDWLRGFVCQPLTYLNQQRWIDWEPVAVVAKPKICPALQKTYDDDKKAVKPSTEIRARLKQLAAGVRA